MVCVVVLWLTALASKEAGTFYSENANDFFSAFSVAGYMRVACFQALCELLEPEASTMQVNAPATAFWYCYEEVSLAFQSMLRRWDQLETAAVTGKRGVGRPVPGK